ncbi:hypothetical protein [Nocardia tengchongensis]|uniref:hypothetical protein n=1 Tax=Nocardia tengchongensis TaxID=2055889 RepID=UPI0036542326
MSATDLRTWAANFAEFRDRVDNYETEAQQINPNGERGAGQMIAFQLAATFDKLGIDLLRGVRPAWMQNFDTSALDTQPHVLLAMRHFLGFTALQADGASLEDARTALRDQLTRLQDTAANWAANGVDAAEKEQITDEIRDLAARVQTAADALNR